MQKLITLFLLINITAKAQSTFFVGANTGFNITTLKNKEDDHAPKGMLNKKNGITPTYGITIGYRVKNKLEIAIHPSYQTYKVNYTGKSDTNQLRSFSMNVKQNYFSLPLSINYTVFKKNRYDISVGLGANISYLLNFNDEGDFNAIVGNFYNIKIHKNVQNSTYDFLTNNATSKATSDQWVYNRINYGFNIKLTNSFSVSNNVKLSLSIFSNYSPTNIENLNTIKYNNTDTSSNYIPLADGYYWSNNSYRYYARSTTQGTRPATHLFSVGAGIGIRYYFKGGLLPSTHY